MTEIESFLYFVAFRYTSMEINEIYILYLFHPDKNILPVIVQTRLDKVANRIVSDSIQNGNVILTDCLREWLSAKLIELLFVTRNKWFVLLGKNKKKISPRRVDHKNDRKDKIEVDEQNCCEY